MPASQNGAAIRRALAEREATRRRVRPVTVTATTSKPSPELSPETHPTQQPQDAAESKEN